MADDFDDTRLPLLPLPNVVHFPRTELKLHVFEARYRRLVEDLLRLDEDSRWIGMVLLKPGWDRGSGAGRPEVFPVGAAGRLVEVETLPDGRANILLRGDFRFELQRELADAEHPYRQAVVRPVEEPRLNERDAGIVAVRTAIVELMRVLSEELRERFPFAEDDVAELAAHCAFEELVNRIAAEVDLPPLRKLQLLQESLPERGLSVLSILRSRQQVLDLLRPYRHLAAANENN
jgi:Lon protease-like protein